MSTRRKRAGLFCPVFAMRREGDLGIGDTQGLIEFFDFAREFGFSVVQILPINETSGDNSPYNAVSSMALEPSTLAMIPGEVPGLTEESAGWALAEAAEGKQGPVRYGRVKALKRALLEQAFERRKSGGWSEAETVAFEKFKKEQEAWLKDYALFRGLMERAGENPVWESWQAGWSNPGKAWQWLGRLGAEKRGAFEERLEFFKFVQWVLDRQWLKVRRAAEEAGVWLMGDLPFGVSRHSADVWAYRGCFNLNWSGGAPPEPMFQQDTFTKVWGQNWGIPVYDWAAMEADDFGWWRQRVGGIVRHFHAFRIDHVLGFYRIYAFPWTPDKNAEVAEMEPEAVQEQFGALPQFLPGNDQNPEEAALNEAQGEKLLKMVIAASSGAEIVAEDLGMVPNYVRPSLARLGISGFKIPLFERIEGSGEYKPVEDYPELSLATFSTHDHETVLGTWEGWWREVEAGQAPDASDEVRDRGMKASWELYRTLRFARVNDRELIREFEPVVMEGMWRRLLFCPSWLVMFSITDALLLTIRFNVPGPVAESNWSERLPAPVQEMAAEPVFARRLALVRGLVSEAGRV
ncbi:MAG: 4-alpha-glucanotransferase [Candidatus Methylacidiphilales bacterium]